MIIRMIQISMMDGTRSNRAICKIFHSPILIQKGYDFSADIWSIGITCIELAEGQAPYMGMAAMKIIMSIINSDPPTLSGSHFSKEFKDFVRLCLQKDPSKRPTAEMLLKHKFLQKRANSDYLIDEFLADIESLEIRIGDKLRYQGEGMH